MAKSYYCAPTVHLTTDQFTIYIVSMIHTYTFRIVHRHCILAVYYEDIDLRYVCHCTSSTIQICHHRSTPTSDLCPTEKHMISHSYCTHHRKIHMSLTYHDVFRNTHKNTKKYVRPPCVWQSPVQYTQNIKVTIQTTIQITIHDNKHCQFR